MEQTHLHNINYELIHEVLIELFEHLKNVQHVNFCKSVCVEWNDYVLSVGNPEKDPYFYIENSTTREPMFSVNNMVRDDEKIVLEFYHEDAVPEYQLELPEEMTPDGYFNYSTLVQHTVPYQFMKDSYDLYQYVNKQYNG